MFISALQKKKVFCFRHTPPHSSHHWYCAALFAFIPNPFVGCHRCSKAAMGVWKGPVKPPGCRCGQWALPNDPERQGNLARVMRVMRKGLRNVTMLPESNLGETERGGEGESARISIGLPQKNNKSMEVRREGGGIVGKSDKPHRGRAAMAVVPVEVAAH